MAWFRRDPRIRWVDVDERGRDGGVGGDTEYLVAIRGRRVTDELRFAKYQGTGNDFVMVVDLDDERAARARTRSAAICDRRTGVGADGVIRLVRAARPDASFVMDYRNADGSLAGDVRQRRAVRAACSVHDLGLTDACEFGIADLGRRPTACGCTMTAGGPPRHGRDGRAGLREGRPSRCAGRRGRRSSASRSTWAAGMTVTGERGVHGEPASGAVRRRRPRSVPRRAHRPRARASRAVPGGNQRGVRTGARRTGSRRRVWERGSGRDHGVRQRRVRGRGGRERGRAGPGADASCGSPAGPWRSSASRAARCS